MYKKIILILFSLGISVIMCAQRIAVSTDVFKLATVAPNISFDIILSPNMSLNVEGVFNPFSEIFKGLSTKQITLSPELRYWFKRPLHSHYLGINLLGSIYDLKLNNNRNKGQIIGIGLGYGYSIIISRRLSFTPAIGFGYGYVLSYTNPEEKLSPIEGGSKLALTRIGLKLSYIIN